MPELFLHQSAPRAQTRKRRGNALIEAALVLLPLLAILFGIIDFGFVIFLKSTFQHAVREGVRYGVTYKTMGGGHDAAIKSVVQQNGMGFLADAAGLSKIKIRYYNPDTLVEVPDNSPGNILEVSVENFSWKYMAPLLNSTTPLSLTSRSSDRMEALPGGTLPPAR